MKELWAIKTFNGDFLGKRRDHWGQRPIVQSIMHAEWFSDKRDTLFAVWADNKLVNVDDERARLADRRAP